MNPERYDVAIAGGGPAGAVAGMVCASLGLRTIVLEAAAEARWKPGEVLAPECNPILRELGLWSVLASRPDVAMPCGILDFRRWVNSLTAPGSGMPIGASL